MYSDRKLAAMKKLYSKQRSNAKQLKVSFTISFDDWKELWDLSGQWENYGKGVDKFSMYRIDKTLGIVTGKQIGRAHV